MTRRRFRAPPEASIKRYPFNHIVIDDFLSPQDHAELRLRFEVLLQNGMRTGRDRSCLSKIAGYDAYSWVFPPDSPMPLAVLIGREFRDYAAELFAIDLTFDVNAQFTHHPPGARTGIWHTDYSVMHHTLVDPPAGGMNVWHYGCNQLSGAATVPGVEVVPRVRALTFLYYLGADGAPHADREGATDLGYRGPASAGVSLFSSIAPQPNRLLIFECGPRSFHRAAGNAHGPRSLVVGWFHMTQEAAMLRHQVAASFPSEDAVKGRFNYNETPSANPVHVA